MVEQPKVVCYHGSSAEHFVAGSEFLKIVKSYVLLQKKYGNGYNQERNDAYNKFFRDKEKRKIRYTDEFANFFICIRSIVIFESNIGGKRKLSWIANVGRTHDLGDENNSVVWIGGHT